MIDPAIIQRLLAAGIEPGRRVLCAKDNLAGTVAPVWTWRDASGYGITVGSLDDGRPLFGFHNWPDGGGEPRDAIALPKK